MNLEEFVQTRGVNLDSLMGDVDCAVGLQPQDTLLVVGSLVEGLGTSKSDLDLLLLTPRAEQHLPPQHDIAIIAGRSVVDIRVLRLSEVDDLLLRLAEWSRLPWDVTKAAKFTEEERVLLHRLFHGQRLAPEVRDSANAVPSPSLKDLARLNLHAARHRSRTIQVDMVGLREDEDYRSLVFAAQELLGHATDALLAGYLLTNPLRKWRSRLLESIPADWESSLTSRPSGLTAGERIWDLHRAPRYPGQDAVVQHALRITTFSRSVFVWAERRLVQESASSEERHSWPVVARRPADSVLPYLDLDVDFVLVDGAVVIARLNDFSEPLILSPREFALALLLDGTTTAREAEAVVGESASGETLFAEPVLDRIRTANLSVR